MANRFVRKSHFRHVYGQGSKKENTYFDLRLSTNGDGNHIAANDKYIIFATSGGGGPCCVVPYGKPGRLGVGCPKLNIHSSKAADFAFNPFKGNVVATAAEDCMVGLSVLPENPEDFKGEPTSSQLLEGHQKKVDFVTWHPTAMGILGSCAHDGIAKVWDVEEGKEALELDMGASATCMEWNTDGSMAACALSNKKSLIWDPRTSKPAFNFKTDFSNAKNIFHDNVGYFGVGGSKMGCHEYHLYDLKKLSEPVTEFEVDDSAGMLLTHYDPDTKMLYVGSKGGSQVKYFELTSKGAMHKLSLHSLGKGIKGFFFLPKLMCDWKQCIIAKSLMVFRDYVEPVDFIVPRKSSLFAKDLYPDAYAGVPAMDGASWLGGENKAPILKSMDPKKKDQAVGGGVKVVSKAELIAENKALKEKVKELEAKIAELSK
mmetsp:Transcript_24860/g.46467  ORF Transcript_24860/g.46467 Transcript_24860/m.46467 type:complete len:429 (-) Transcript_24860:94-1380(-)|eukprot:CAMPEP_0170166834 /NCGR_PEP_ID=MMETSP0040_2-20121228/405_1 /TAXON_ID=641309 /ORGANISM="Lotharella oceanica, Strain CCMP622" /LENGTH=428 /DNA_ID=CAMNT_0010404665 /DNA_START=25 /DNA_END=1311 /DNA_ORIENTATION=-